MLKCVPVSAVTVLQFNTNSRRIYSLFTKVIRRPEWEYLKPTGSSFLFSSVVLCHQPGEGAGDLIQYVNHMLPVASCSSSLMAFSVTIPLLSMLATILISATTSVLQPFFSSRESLRKYLSMPLKSPWMEEIPLSVMSTACITGLSTKVIIWTALRISQFSE